MIITQTPLRLSFLGGGTDFKEYINENKFGCVLSSAINKYIYVFVKTHGELYKEKIRLNYSQTETVNDISLIKNEIIRESLKFLKIKDRLYISTIADLPAMSGLGSSSSFCVGLLNALYTFKGEKISPIKIACNAFAIEKEILKKNVGMQDHIISAIGGMNYIKMYKKKINYEKIKDQKVINKIFELNLCFCLNKYRKAESVLRDQVKNQKKNLISFNNMRSLAIDGYKDIKDENYSEFFKKIALSWDLKKTLSKRISYNKVDNAYNECLKIGAYGGKISGAGGGGFLNIFSKKKFHKKILQQMKKFNFNNININYSASGTKFFVIK
jgi:D-glycero-alpha-D-manno-heptose-7-phosphate kinase